MIHVEYFNNPSSSNQHVSSFDNQFYASDDIEAVREAVEADIKSEPIEEARIQNRIILQDRSFSVVLQPAVLKEIN